MTTLKPLYHYTSQKGLHGILKTNKLWMTNILYLNDSSEFIHPMGLFNKEWNDRLKDTLEEMYSQGMFKKESISIPDLISQKIQSGNIKFQNYITTIATNIFIFSLSEREDDLSQRRGYCPDTSGFCIEFDRKRLLDILEKKDNYKIDVCLYKNNDEKLIEIKKIFHDYIPDHKTSIRNWIKNIEDPVNKLFVEIVHKSSFLKDYSFRDEEEYRIMYEFCKDDEEYIDFYDGKTMIKPCYKGDLKDDNGKLPISKIWVGQTPHTELSMLSVDLLLKSKGYNEVEVIKSNIPYRPL